ncbi:hypothetical protein BD560DRAFT_381254 [Blakeslea trispora]|nr:hypothetical protein BD560DRAFT_381254 [Blakeslea trispora]
MAPHPIPQNHPLPNPEVQDRFKRRLQTPGQLAPTPRSRKIQILSWALSIGNNPILFLEKKLLRFFNLYTLCLLFCVFIQGSVATLFCLLILVQKEIVIPL